jgi:replicative DNA helicase
MRLSAPIFRLKREAKLLSRRANIPLNQALDRLARAEGFNSWSLLAARASANLPSSTLFASLKPGDLVLLAARPGHGKTLMGLELIVEAIKAGRRGVFFTLECHERDVGQLLRSIGGDLKTLKDGFEFDTSDAISSDYIIGRLGSAPRGSVVVIDYLQLLDQRRQNPALADQVSALKSFASKTGLIIVFISQIDRSYELSGRPLPNITDVRLPNPLDLTLFSKTCFLNNGEVEIEAVS